MRIAYLINNYPKVSHSFIRREILALERKEIRIMRISLRGWNDVLPDREDQLEQGCTRYALRGGAPYLIIALARMALLRPVRLLRALSLVWRIGRRADRPLSVHLVYLAEACRIESWFRAADIQHVHVHFGTNSATVAMLVHALGGPRWSFTIHGPEEFEKAKIIRLAEKVRCCEFVVAVSSFGRSQIYSLVEPQYWPKVHVVHCGLEADFSAVPPASPTIARRLICVGRLIRQKGHVLLIEAARRLAKLGTKFELVFAGDGEMRAEIEELIALYNLQTQVWVTGWLSSDKVREEILTARALVLPTFAEGLPVVIMEAMALRRPVISTFVAGIPELVQAGETGWLVPAGDVDALRDAMQECLGAPDEQLSKMGEAARTRVLERHNVDVSASQLAALFEGRF